MKIDSQGAALNARIGKACTELKSLKRELRINRWLLLASLAVIEKVKWLDRQTVRTLPAISTERTIELPRSLAPSERMALVEDGLPAVAIE